MDVFSKCFKIAVSGFSGVSSTALLSFNAQITLLLYGARGDLVFRLKVFQRGFNIWAQQVRDFFPHPPVGLIRKPQLRKPQSQKKWIGWNRLFSERLLVVIKQAA
ncbi:MAG TPA: hypothetical protein VIE17_08150 [Methylophilaceae bacterium]